MTTQQTGIQEVFASLRVNDTNAAMRFYAAAFGAVEKFRLAEPSGRIGHAQMQWGPSVLMLSDPFPEFSLNAPRGDGDTDWSSHLHVDNADAVSAKALTAGRGF